MGESEISQDVAHVLETSKVSVTIPALKIANGRVRINELERAKFGPFADQIILGQPIHVEVVEDDKIVDQSAITQSLRNCLVIPEGVAFAKLAVLVISYEKSGEASRSKIKNSFLTEKVVDNARSACFNTRHPNAAYALIDNDGSQVLVDFAEVEPPLPANLVGLAQILISPVDPTVCNFKQNVLYTGVTNNLARRMFEHKEKLVERFYEKVLR